MVGSEPEQKRKKPKHYHVGTATEKIGLEVRGNILRLDNKNDVDMVYVMGESRVCGSKV